MLRSYLYIFAVFSGIFIFSCANNNSDGLLLGQSNFVIEKLDEQNVCQLTFQLSNLSQEQITLIEVSLWLNAASGEYTRLNLWQGNDLLTFLSGDQFLEPATVKTYTYDFAPHIVDPGEPYSLDLQIIGVNTLLPTLAQLSAFCPA